MNALSTWLSTAAGSRVVVARGDARIGADEFRADVAALARELSNHERGRWLVCTESAYACAVGLFAAWQAGSIAVLPPNPEAGTLRELAAGTCGLVTDRAEDVEGLRCVPALGLPRAATPAWITLPRDRVLLELCTSGSTGARKIVAKTLDQLEAEIDELESLLGPRYGDAFVLGTVSHQHIYGLLFRVLWPLCAGRVLVDEAFVDPGLIARELERGGAALLVGSPAHLKRFPELVDLRRFKDNCREIFSSGGPLDAATAQRYVDEVGFAPLEVLGSTETGGIAFRRQSGAAIDQAWTTFPGARVETRDGLLHVRSRPAGAPDGVTTGDAIEWLTDGRFLLLGRADRIVKLFDERISLTELETRLCAHPFVKESGALTLARNETPRIAAAIVLSAAGADFLRDSGRRALIDELSRHLRDYFRATALPRAWRFVPALPEDAQGKTSAASLAALFTDGGETHGGETHGAPRVVKREPASDRAFEIELEVPEDLWALSGHFEGFPVVPGVVQIQWTIDQVAAWIGHEPRIAGIEALKFKQILSAGSRFKLRLERAGKERDEVRFRMWTERGDVSSGRLILEGGAP